MYPRHHLDVSVRDLLFGLSACLWARRRRLVAKIARTCSSDEDALLVCFSVRSGLDLLLGALALPPGSEVLVSAVTHPDVVHIVEGHGLRAVPVDLAPATLAPRSELLARALTPRTRAILIAHLFGGRVDLGPAAGFAKTHGLLLLEDCAQAFRGPRDLGDPLADVSMFSFGPIKTASAVGGALLCVRDPVLREGMRRAQEAWPTQRRRDYAGRLLKVLCLALVGRPLPYRLFAGLCGLLGRDLDALVNGAVRAFPPAGSAIKGPYDGLFRGIRHRPCAPLLALLMRRLCTFDADRLARRAAVGEEVALRLPALFRHPGGFAPERTHWLVPVVAPDPQKLIFALRRRGFDASRATSNITVVGAPPDLPDLVPEEVTRIMSNVVFLPVYPELPNGARRRLIRALEEAAYEEVDSTREGRA